MGGLSRFVTLVRRDLALALAGASDAGTAIGFFAIVVALFPLGIGPEPNLLARIGGGVVLVAALLAALLALERMFAADYDDGSLDQLALMPVPLEAVVAAKALAHWLTTGLPLIVLAPVMGIALRVPEPAIPALLLATVLATPILSLIGAIGASLSLGARRGGVLVSFLVLPFFVPVLIFAAGAVDQAATGGEARVNLLLLSAVLALALPLAPVAAAAAIRQALE